MKQNVLCQSRYLIKHIVVPVSVSDVASLEVSLLVIERVASARSVSNFEAIFDSGKTEFFNNFNRVRLWRFVNAVSPCEILTGIVGIDSDCLRASVSLIILVMSFLHVVILNLKLNMGGCCTKGKKVDS